MDNKHVLNNGICIVSEDIPSFYSIAVGIWIKNGSRYEDKTASGTSHFIEHMIFKGTKKRTAKQIAEEMDSIGGQLDAFTGVNTLVFTLKLWINICQWHWIFYLIFCLTLLLRHLR